MPVNPARGSSGDEIPDEYIAGGEPGVVVRPSLQIESIDHEDQEERVR
jgi:hypothetical protein